LQPSARDHRQAIGVGEMEAAPAKLGAVWAMPCCL